MIQKYFNGIKKIYITPFELDNIMEKKPKSDMITLFWAVTDSGHNLFRRNEGIFSFFLPLGK